MATADPLADIRAGFLAECEELMERLTDALASADLFTPGSAAIHGAFRAVHTLKGGAASLGYEDLAGAAHGFEERLERIRAGAPVAGDCDLSHLLAEADRLAALVAGLSGPRGLAPPLSQAPAWQLAFTPAPDLYATGNEVLHLLNALGALGSEQVRCDQGNLPPLDLLDPERSCLAWSMTLPGEVPEPAIREVFEFVEHLCDLRLSRAAGEARPAPAPPTAADLPTIRVDAARVDRLLDLAGELAIAQTTLSTLLRTSGISRHAHPAMALEAFAALTHDLQDAVMAIRTQPIKPLFQRMARSLREAAARVGKSARLICEGEATEVDRAIIEQLAEPLTHMIRNAIDHGLETAERRLQAGKPAEGTVRLSAATRAGRIVIELADDGAGIDRTKVRQTAIRRGLIEENADLGEEEIDALLFQPGFSTADEVTALSGRGVGMDAVRTAITALGGRIAIASAPGQGTRFTLSLPLTLAVLDGLLVSAAGQIFVFPLASTLETAPLDTAPLHRAGSDVPLVRLRGRHVPLVSLALLLGLPDPAGHSCRPGIAVLISDEEDRWIAVGVDDILEQAHVVIKDLRGNCGDSPGIAAATLLGDGRVALILDPGALLNIAARQASATALIQEVS